MTGATRQLAEFAACLQYEDIPAAACETIKLIILDTLGAALAATTLGVGCDELVRTGPRLAGGAEATVLGFGNRVGLAAGAFVNGGLAHALNFDPIGPDVGHVGLVALAAPLAVVEARRATGRDLLTAAVAAAEIAARLSAAQAKTGKPANERYLSGQVFGYFGAAAGAARAFGLDTPQMHSAFGLALMQAAGTMQVVIGGDPPAKAIYGAFPNYAGVVSALLSAEGLGAECDAFEGQAGVYAMFYEGRYDATTLTAGLGESFVFPGAQFKPWPTSGMVHPFIEAACELYRDGIVADDIRTIEVTAHPRVRVWCEPLPERCRPANPASAANSIPFGIAKALANGEVTLADFTASGIGDLQSSAIADRISVTFDDAIVGARVRACLADGRFAERAVRIPLGHPSRPLDRRQIEEKFARCCGHSVRPLSDASIAEMVDTLNRLEDVADIGRLLDLARGQA